MHKNSQSQLHNEQNKKCPPAIMFFNNISIFDPIPYKLWHLVWGSAITVERVHKLQKQSIRIICNKSYNYHTEPLFKQHKILTLKDQYRYNVGIFMHNMRQNKVPISFTNLNYFTTPERFTLQSQHQYANQKRARATFSSLLPFNQIQKNGMS